MSWINGRTEAFWGMFVADALSMPTHWFYDQQAIKRIYGDWIKGYTAPKTHPGTQLWKNPNYFNLDTHERLCQADEMASTEKSNVSRSDETRVLKDDIIGRVILHDKLEFWTKEDSSIHYHQGMEAGDNTLNLLIAMETVKVIADYDDDGSLPPMLLQCAVLQHYCAYMTTVGKHNDTYAEDFHREFFRDWANEVNPPELGAHLQKFTRKRWAVAEDSPVTIQPHNGVLPLVIPYIIFFCDSKPEDECIQIAFDNVKLLFPVPDAYPLLELYCSVLYGLLRGRDITKQVQRALKSELMDNKRDVILQMVEEAKKFPAGSEELTQHFISATNTLGPACGLEGGLAVVFMLALHYHDDFEAGVLMNANCGGENCHRGAALGALLGAQAGNTLPGEGISSELKDGLHSARFGVKRVVTLFC